MSAAPQESVPRASFARQYLPHFVAAGAELLRTKPDSVHCGIELLALRTELGEEQRLS